MKITKILILGGFLFFCMGLNAQTETFEQAKLKELSSSQVWNSLIHYEKKDDEVKGVLSAIHNPKFFLSPQGAFDPEKELLATIHAFEGKSKVENVHCQFPARLQWLNKKLQPNKFKNFDFEVCKDFQDWSQNGRVESISVVYATGYLGNPASFYGHTLLKFNSKDQTVKTSLQDNSLNFGAIVPDNENPLVYIFKGIFGGYEAGFSQIQYYFHNENYGEIELRDMWEYQLNLEQADVDFIVAHSWEVMSKEYTYYFLRENCAYRMGELFSILEGVDIIPNNSVYTYPQSLIKELSEETYKGEKLLKKVTINPSRQSRLYSKYSQLDSKELLALNHVIETKDFSNKSIYQELNHQQKRRVLDALIDYYRLVRDESAGEKDPNNQNYNNTLKERFLLKPGKSSFKKIKSFDSPHDSRNPSLTTISVGENGKYGSYQTLTLRPAYYDSLDATSGHIPFSELTMGEFAITKSDHNFYLDYLDVVSIESVNSRTTGLPGDDGFSWRLKFGAEQFDYNCSRCRVIRIQGDAGYSYKLGDNLLFATYLGGSLHETHNNSENYLLRASLFFQHNFSERLNYKVNYQYRNDLNNYSQSQLEFQLRYLVARNWDLRVFHNKAKNSVSGISFGYYW